MGHTGTPKFTNDVGAQKIEIGVKEFECIGAKAPFDHPHIYLDMGQDNQIICPYCSTLYIHNDKLGDEETVPADCCLASHAESA